MCNFKAINTSLGLLRGKDCISFGNLNLSQNSTLVFEGKIKRSNLDSPGVSRETSLETLPLKLEFLGVIAYKVTEFETWSTQAEKALEQAESFIEMLDSPWIDSLCANKVNCNRHYLLKTSNLVVEVICRQFKWTA